MQVADDKAGKRGKCPKCALMVRVPQSQAGAETAEAHRVLLRTVGGSMPSQRDDDDFFGDVVTEVLSASAARRAPAGADPPPATPPAGAEGPLPPADPEALRLSAEAPSAPPMSWPASASPSGATGQAVAAQTTAPGKSADSGEDSADPDSPEATAATAGAKGGHGLWAMLGVLVVSAGVVGVVAWQNWQHVSRFSDAITRCLPNAAFPTDGARPRAMPGCLTGKVLLCNASGGPCPPGLLPNWRLVATSAEQVGTVIFIRRNDHAPEAQAFRVMGRRPARPAAAYEMCAVDARSGRRICADTVVAADKEKALEALCRLINTCVRR